MATLHISHTWNGESVAAAERCFVEVTGTETAWLVEVNAPFHGDPPPPAPSGSLDGLWSFEVVELFVAAAGPDNGGVDYTEVELSPPGHYLILRFAGVRRRVARLEPLSAHCRITGDRWHGRIELPRGALPPPPWRANAFAMHGLGEARRHLAATPLPGGRPDFHQPRVFRRFFL